jgi:hypothetical protein
MSSTTAATRIALADNRVHEANGDDHGHAAESESDESGQEAELNVHPLARSTRRTSNGRPPDGVTSKVNPQWPTITSAGEAWE